MIRKREYDWHEMTFFIHQLDSLGSHVTVLCFEVPDDPVNDNLTKSVEPEFKTTPYNFLDELKSELTRLPAGTIPDWQYMQSLLLRQAIIVVDRGIWTCSKAVRDLEKVRLVTAAVTAGIVKGCSDLNDSPDWELHPAHTIHSTSLPPTIFYGISFIIQRPFKLLHRHLSCGLSNTKRIRSDRND